jgi:RNA polymerase sigma-70 factor (ECF subfamily)
VQRQTEPEDMVQSVFRRFFRRIQQADYDVPAGEELWGLFLVIALNRIRSEETFQRAGKRDLRRTVTPGAEFHNVAGPHEDADYVILQLTVSEALAQLPPPQREMLELRIQGHEVAEIAKRIGRSKRTVERNLQEIRTRLRCQLEVPGPDDPDDPTRPGDA